MSGGEPSSIKRIAVVCREGAGSEPAAVAPGIPHHSKERCAVLPRIAFYFPKNGEMDFVSRLCTGNTGRKPLTMWWGSRSSPKRSRPRCRTGRLSHAYLFIGTRGTGKTVLRAAFSPRRSTASTRWTATPATSATPAAALRTAPFMDVVEIDAASNNGVDNVRHAARRGRSSLRLRFKKRVYIIDEVHMLSKRRRSTRC